MGTKSTLLFERPRDVLSSSFDDWPFLSVHFWGEKADGRWTLEIVNAGNRHVNEPGVLKKWQLIFYGTSINPIRVRPAGRPLSSSPWKTPLNAYTFPTLADSPPVTQVTDNGFFNPDPFKGFQNFPNVYSFSGSEPEPAISSLDGKKTKIRDNDSNSIDDLDEETKENCSEQCDDQGCFGGGPGKCIACRNKRMDR